MPIYPKTGSGEGILLVNKIGDKRLDREKLKKSCADFESVFIQQLLKSMRQTMMRSDFMGNGIGKDVYESLLDQELSQSLARRGGLGLGKMIYDRMIQQEEKRGVVPPEGEKTEADPAATKLRSPLGRGNFNAISGR